MRYKKGDRVCFKRFGTGGFGTVLYSSATDNREYYTLVNVQFFGHNKLDRVFVEEVYIVDWGSDEI